MLCRIVLCVLRIFRKRQNMLQITNFIKEQDIKWYIWKLVLLKDLRYKRFGKNGNGRLGSVSGIEMKSEFSYAGKIGFIY